jgi:serine/threonine protein kinase
MPPPTPSHTNAHTLPRDLEGGFQLHALIGEGGMGRVYRGMQTLLDRPVAVKMIKPNPKEERLLTARFMREAKVVAAIDHPHVVRVLHFGRTVEHELFLVMEFLEGQSLDELLDQQGRLGVLQTVHIVQQICSGLGAAHRQGVVHRDLKPANIMLVERDGDPNFVKVLDFGVAKVIDDPNSVTQVGFAVGTYDYMAPEQIMAKAVDGRTDIYALGVLLYRVLSGRRPFGGSDEISLAQKHLKRMPDPLRAHFAEGALPPDLEDVVQKCLAKKPEDRFSSMEDLRVALMAAVPEGFVEIPASRAPARLKRTQALHPSVVEKSDPFHVGSATTEKHNLPTETGTRLPTSPAQNETVVLDSPAPDPVQAEFPTEDNLPTLASTPAIHSSSPPTRTTQIQGGIHDLSTRPPLTDEESADASNAEIPVQDEEEDKMNVSPQNANAEEGDRAASKAPALSEPIDYLSQASPETGYFGRIVAVLVVVGLLGLGGALIYRGLSSTSSPPSAKAEAAQAEAAKAKASQAEAAKAEAAQAEAAQAEAAQAEAAQAESAKAESAKAEDAKAEAAKAKAEAEKWSAIKEKIKARAAQKKAGK